MFFLVLLYFGIIAYLSAVNDEEYEQFFADNIFVFLHHMTIVLVLGSDHYFSFLKEWK